MSVLFEQGTTMGFNESRFKNRLGKQDFSLNRCISTIRVHRPRQDLASIEKNERVCLHNKRPAGGQRADYCSGSEIRVSNFRYTRLFQYRKVVENSKFK